MKTLFFIIGTRPEAIKLAPLIYACQNTSYFKPYICLSGQHISLVHPIISFFKLTIDTQLDLTPTQNLAQFTAEGLQKITPLLAQIKPDLVVTQGDTHTSLIGALAAFYQKIPLAHIEAGLRTHQKYTPFPEEMNRLLIDQLSTYHFAPTSVAIQNLQAENITQNAFNVGNTGIDALHLALERLPLERPFPTPYVVVTCHRRENWDQNLDFLIESLAQIASEHPNLTWVFPCHPNPLTQSRIKTTLAPFSNIQTPDPYGYPNFVHLLRDAEFILTDSGGIQEEATVLGKPTLVLRTHTERPEAHDLGITCLIDPHPQTLLPLLKSWIQNPPIVNPQTCYGTGQASQKIVHHLQALLNV